MNLHDLDVLSLAHHVGCCLRESCARVVAVADRRGSRVYRLTFPTGDVALKLVHHSDEHSVRQTEHLARREAAVLSHLDDFTPGYLIDSGGLQQDGGSWLAVRWLDGITPYHLLEPARQGDDSPAQRASILRAAAGIADRLAVLHARGWLHADLQSPHIILGPTTVHFIDFALAQGTHPLPTEVTYRGGMLDFMAPETATQVLTTPDDQPITITEPAEVYALATVLHHAWTGRFPTAYTNGYQQDRLGRLARLNDVAHGRHHDLTAIRPWPWPAFENVLRHALSPEPENRTPTMTTFRDALNSSNTSTNHPRTNTAISNPTRSSW